MTHKTMEVKLYNFTSQDHLFLDANIWWYLYVPQRPNDRYVKIYSQAFKCILHANSHIYIDVLIVSEFINAYARLKWSQFEPQIKPFKNFRNSPHFKPVAKDITAAVKQILKHCSPIESGFTTLKIDDLLNDYAVGNSDFNDQVITELCKRKGLTLVTHDGDFRGKGIPILTTNRRLLGGSSP